MTKKDYDDSNNTTIDKTQHTINDRKRDEIAVQIDIFNFILRHTPPKNQNWTTERTHWRNENIELFSVAQCKHRTQAHAQPKESVRKKENSRNLMLGSEQRAIILLKALYCSEHSLGARARIYTQRDSSTITHWIEHLQAANSTRTKHTQR